MLVRSLFVLGSLAHLVAQEPSAPLPVVVRDARCVDVDWNPWHS